MSGDRERLVQLLDDQSLRWRQGERPSVETYLRVDPSLASDPEAVLDLIYNELVQREKHGETPRLEEYLSRFPHLAEQLRVQFEVHGAVESNAAVADRTTASWQAETALPQHGGRVLLGRYVLLRKLGQGGMGEVYQARHLLLDRIDAVKVIRADLLSDPSILARFHREARAAARLSHPHIVAVYDAGEADRRHFLALEFVEGVDLGRLIHKSGPLPWPTVCVFLQQTAEALQHAHEQGLVHRDIKPSNLMLCRRTERVKVLDFGLASLRDVAVASSDRLTPHQQVMGTPDYIAPEQTVNARTVDIRADLYSLGCTAYHLLAGEVPFPAGNLIEKVLRHRQDQPRPLREFRRDLPPTLAAVVARLMAKDPAARYQVPAELSKALRPLLPTTTAPRRRATQAPAKLTAQPMRRRPSPNRLRWLLLIGLAVVCLAGGLVALAFLPGLFRPGATPTGTGTAPIRSDRLRWEPGRTFPVNDLQPFGLAFTPDGQSLAVTGGEYDKPEAPGPVRLLDLNQGRWYPLGEHRCSARCLAFTPDGKTLISTTGTYAYKDRKPGDVKGEVTFWDMSPPQYRNTVNAFATEVRSLAVHPGGWLVAGSNDGLRRIDIGTGAEQSIRPGGGSVNPTRLAFSTGGALLACGYDNGDVEVLETAGCTRRHHFPAAPDKQIFVSGLAFRPGDRELVGVTGLSMSGVAEIKVWDLAAGQLRYARAHGGIHLMDMDLAPDGRTLATGACGGRVQIWDVEEGRLLQELEGEHPCLWAVRFSPDGKTLASSGQDQMIRLWHGRPRP